MDVLVPVYSRLGALAVTLATLAGQTFRAFRVVISDQTEDADAAATPEVAAVRRLLQAHGHPVEVHKHLPRRGMAEQRQFLLDRARAPYALFLDADLLLEPWGLAQMVRTLREERCGFVGCAAPGLSFLQDVRPHEQRIEVWEGPVRPGDGAPRHAGAGASPPAQRRQPAARRRPAGPRTGAVRGVPLRGWPR